MDFPYDDDRPADRADEREHDELPPGTGAPDLGFEAPDLASAFLAALDDAADDRRFVSPSLEDLLSDQLIAHEPAAMPEPVTESVAESVAESVFGWGAEPMAAEPEPPPAFEAPETLMMRLEPLEAGTLDIPAVEAQAPVEVAAPAVANAAEAEAAAEYVVEHDDPAATAGPASPSAQAVAEAFAREQAALELWGSDEASAALEAAAEDTASTEYAESIEAVDSIESIAATQAPGDRADSVPSWSASVNTDTPAELIAETVSNADSYYDPDTLRLTRPLFSPDEPRAFAAPIYVPESQDAADGEGAADSAASADLDVEVLEDLEEFVAFSLGDTRCVVPIRNVIEIGRIPQAVAVPNAPAWLHGLGNLRGQVLSLIDLRAFLGIGRVRPATGRMLVLRADDDEVQAGLLVDHVHQIVSLSASRFHPVPETLARHYARHAWGVCDYGNYTMIGLEVDNLLGVENMVPLGEAAAEAV